MGAESWLPALPVADYQPDMPQFNNPGSRNILNALPRTPQSYGPMPRIISYGGGLRKACQGAYACLDNGGDVNIFAGDANDLYQYTSNSTSAVQVSKAAHGYNLAADSQWRFAYFGGRIIATDFESNLQSFVLGSSAAFADLAAAAPQGRYIAVVKNFLCVANTNDPTNGEQPQAVWWSAINDPTNWPTPGTATAAQFQSSFNNLYGDGGWIQGIVGNLGTADGAIFMEHAVWRMVYAGAPNVFDFLPAEGVRGTPAPGSIVQLGAFVYYLGEDGFYVFDGTSSQPIGANRVDKAFFADADPNYYGRMSSSVDPVNKMIWWAYAGMGATAGIPNKMLGYNWQLDKWTLVQDDNFPGSSFVESLVRAYTFGNTLDSVGAVSLDTASWNLFPMDSRVWTGGVVLFGGFTAALNGNTAHALGYFNGANYAATIETTEVQPFPGSRAHLRNCRPLTDAPAASVKTTLLARDTQQATTYRGTGNSITVNAIGCCPQICNGRYVKGQIKIAQAAAWTECQGLELEGRNAGFQ